MRIVVVTPPAPVVTLAEAKAHLRVTGTAEDTLIEGMVAAATQHLDGPAGWLGRALGVQELEARLDLSCHPSLIRLSFPPITSVTSVTYLDANRAPIVADPATYELIGEDVIAIGAPAWANAYSGREALRVRFVAGYAVLPAPIRGAILLMVGDLYAHRETTSPVATTSIPISVTVQALLEPFRVYR